MQDYHEPFEVLSEEIKDKHRILISIIEELEAVDWYEQRIDATNNPTIKKILSHNRDEEIEHALMGLEWLRRNYPTWNKNMKEYLFTKGEIVKHASIVELGLEKIANKKSNEKSNKKQKVRDGAMIGGGLGALALSKDRVLGKKTLYHGTSKDNWNKIKNEGLRANKGGTGAAQMVKNMGGSNDYINASKGYVHATRFKPIANMYSHVGDKKSGFWDMANEGKPKFKELGKTFLTENKKGKTIKIKGDYDKWKKMKLDTDAAPIDSSAGRLEKNLAKNFAAKGKVNFTPEEIKGSSSNILNKTKHTFKKMPNYIKNNPVRFGTGVALAGGGTYLINKALKNRKRRKNNELQRIGKISD